METHEKEQSHHDSWITKKSCEFKKGETKVGGKKKKRGHPWKTKVEGTKKKSGGGGDKTLVYALPRGRG